MCCFTKFQSDFVRRKVSWPDKVANKSIMSGENVVRPDKMPNRNTAIHKDYQKKKDRRD